MLKSVFGFGSPIRLPSTWYEEPTGTPPPNPAPAGDGKGAADGKTDPPTEEKKFTEADVEAARKAAADAERQKEAAKQAAAKKAAEEKELADKAEWKKLADNRAAEIEALKVVRDENTALRETINTMIAAEIEKWPAEVKDLDPGADNVTARLAWVTKGRALAAKLGATQAPPPAPNTQQGKKPATANAGSAKPNAQADAGTQGGEQRRTYFFQNASDVRW